MAGSLQSNEHEILGFPALLPENVLPTKSDVLKRILLSKETFDTKVTVAKFVQPVTIELIMIWDKASLPTVQHRTIENGLISLWNKATHASSKNPLKKQSLQDEKFLLFDICSCKCKRLSCSEARCSTEECEEIHMDCICASDKKVPVRELEFLFDQRGPRKMFISGTDQKVTSTMKKSQKRAAVFELQKEKEKKRIQDETKMQIEANADFFDKDDEDDNEQSKDPDFQLPPKIQEQKTPHTRNMHKLPNTAAAADRWNISSVAAADICNSYALDMGFLTEENKEKVTVDKNKLNRWRKKQRNEVNSKLKASISSKPPTALYFDGKKDATLTHQEKDGKLYTKTVLEEHYVMVEEPESVYLGHEVPFSGHGISVGLKSFRFLKSKGWDAAIHVVGADGCNVNTGHNEGAIVYLEKLLGRPLQWFICLLHGVELPLRAIIRELDGETSGPFSLKGPIGSTLGEDLNELPIVSFKSIPNPDFPSVADDGIYELSKDQHYLHSMSHAVMDGHVSEDLANITPGPLSMSRWLTLAGRILRKYVATEKPTKKFQAIVHAIVNFYAPSWFHIKTHPNCTDGPKNLFKMVENSRKLSLNLQEIVQKVLQRNGYFAHSEAILLSMLADSNGDIRAQAVNTILTIRMKADSESLELSGISFPPDNRGVDDVDDDNECSDDETPFTLEPSEKFAIENAKVRKFKVPKINFLAQSYIELIDWEDTALSEPPLTLSKTNEELLAYKESPLVVPKYPCHTQAVERAVRLVSEASAAVIGQEARDGYIRQRMEARKILPNFETKKEFYPKITAQS